MNQSLIEFVELRRLNHTISLDSITVINTFQDLIKLYGELRDSKYPRSAPIPLFDENKETILVVKPKIENIKNGDFEIKSIQKLGSSLTINYKEVENWEYKEKKLENPIVIIKVTETNLTATLNKL